MSTPPATPATAGRRPGGPPALTVTGDLDHDSHLVLLDATAHEIGAGHDRIVLDLAAVAFCDSTGLGALVRIQQGATAHGGWLRLARPAPVLRRMLEITNLDQLLPVYDTVQDAGTAPP